MFGDQWNPLSVFFLEQATEVVWRNQNTMMTMKSRPLVRWGGEKSQPPRQYWLVGSSQGWWGVPSLKLTASFQARNLRDSRGLFAGDMLVSGRSNFIILLMLQTSRALVSVDMYLSQLVCPPMHQTALSGSFRERATVAKWVYLQDLLLLD